MLKAGDKAPEWNVVDQNGNVQTLQPYRGRKVFLYFYPKADTPGCTQQSCLLRDLIVGGKIGDVFVIGASPDKAAKQKKFDLKHELGFPLLADVEHQVAESYGVWKEKMLYGRKYMGIERSAFLLNEEGMVQNAWYKISPKDTPTVLLGTIGRKVEK